MSHTPSYFFHAEASLHRSQEVRVSLLRKFLKAVPRLAFGNRVTTSESVTLLSLPPAVGTTRDPRDNQINHTDGNTVAPDFISQVPKGLVVTVFCHSSRYHC